MLLFALLLLLTGCKEQDKCLRSHIERRHGVSCSPVGKASICTPRVYHVSVCDEYEHGDFICTREESE